MQNSLTGNIIFNNISYTHDRRVMKKLLNYSNIENIKYKDLQKIEDTIKSKYWEKYKVSLFLEWMKINNQYSMKFIRLCKRISKNLNINEIIKIREAIDTLVIREFTFARSFKSIEVPYKIENFEDAHSNFAYFFYQNTKLYKDNFWISKIFEGEFYITKTELVFFDRKDNLIFKIISFDNLNFIKKYNYGIELLMDDNEKIILKYVDLEILFISLKRILDKFKKDIKIEDFSSNKRIENINN